MIYMEMSRTENHGGGDWAFPKCVWSPSHKTNGQAWPYWNKILKIEKGDTIIHLRGKQPQAKFVGFSIASSDGYETNDFPPELETHSRADSFFRADLNEFTEFDEPISLTNIFKNEKIELEKHLNSNKSRTIEKANLFFVRQNGVIRCQNGAYLSDVSERLLTILFGNLDTKPTTGVVSNINSVSTRSQLSLVKSRLGQNKFSKLVKDNYQKHCCFPNCSIRDRKFLIGAHIDRWSDNEKLRGHLGNGLCLCLVHDKAFEIGMFTIDKNLNVLANSSYKKHVSSIMDEIFHNNGKPIFKAQITPLMDALKAHWKRVNLTPIQ